MVTNPTYYRKLRKLNGVSDFKLLYSSLQFSVFPALFVEIDILFLEGLA